MTPGQREALQRNLQGARSDVVSAVFRSRGKSPTGNPEEDEFDAEITYRDGTTQRGPVGRSYAAGAQAEWGDAVRIEDEAPIPEPTPLPPQPAPSAYAVALERQRAGKLPVGRAALMDDDVAARPAFKPMSPEESSKADFGVEGFLERLRAAGEASPTAARILAKAGPKPPTVDVARPGVAALSDVRPLSAPAVANEQEGTVTRASVPQEAPPTSAAGDAEFAAAQGQARDMRLAAALGRAGAMANEAISGARFDRGAYDGMEASANAPVAELLARREADKRKRLEDPTSPESRRFQQGVSKALGGVYSPEEIAEMTAADEPFVARYGEMRSRLDERREAATQADLARRAGMEREDAIRAEDRAYQQQQAGASRAFQSSEAAKQRAFQREMAGLNNAADLQQAQARSGAGPGGAARGTVIPGLEVEPGAAPTAADATKVKTALEAKKRLSGDLQELRALHAKHGTEMVGAVAERMSQLMTSIRLEGKTLADLGAITGPDWQIIQSLSGADPTSLGANLKAFFTGGKWDHTASALDGVEQWASNRVNAAKSVYGYRDAGPAARAVVDRIRMPDGRTVVLYSDGSEETQ